MNKEKKRDKSKKDKKLEKQGQGRVNFRPGVPEILFKRAGGECSVPRCKNPTMGPFDQFQGAVNMGVACHIYSAAEEGPRGRGDKAPEFISSAENGIWCCQYHAALIDKSKGVDYPANVLFAWKKLAEARTSKRMNDRPSPLGWVDSIQFSKFAKREGLPQVSLSRCTLLWGKNGAGKTVLLEAAASISQSKYSERFTGTRIKKTDGSYEAAEFRAKVVYSTVDSFSKELNLEIIDDRLTRLEGKLPCLLPPGDLEVIYCSRSDLARSDGEDDIDYMTRVLNVDKSALFALARIGVNTIIPGNISFEQAIEEDEDGGSRPCCKIDGNPYYQLLFKKTPRDFFVSYGGLSGSEKDRLVLDLLVAKAREVSKQRLTLLLIEDLAFSLDAGNFENLLTKLADEEFQVIMTVPPAREKDILQVQEGHRTLKPLDYLEPWRLAIIDSLDSLPLARPA